jgi:hypothetical protein
VEDVGKTYVTLDNGSQYLPHELKPVKKPMSVKPKENFDEITPEGMLKALSKLPLIDDKEERSMLELENEKGLKEKMEKRKERVKKKPKKFL